MIKGKVVITGCDSNTAWMLPWFIKNYKKHNDIPLIVCDFGMNEEQLNSLQDVVIYPLNNTSNVCAWFKKPEALLEITAVKKVWLDTDCEVLGNLEPIFKSLYTKVLNMVIDHPWSQRSGEKWHNSGVVGVFDKPPILYDWYANCRKNVEQRGDQEVLHVMKKDWGFMNYVHDLPHQYNVLRLDIQDNNVPKDPLIFHWTGPKGKEIIRKKMNA